MKVIIVPTDFSENASNAVKYAIEMSKMHYNKLIFVHVYSMPFLNPDAGMVYDEAFSESMRIQADKALRAHIDEVYNSMGMHRNLLLSELEVVEAISLSGGIQKINTKYKADLVIMGTHGATGLKKIFLGSNAVDLIDNIHIPVLTIPEQVQFEGIRTITFACDFIQVTNEIEAVVSFAKSFNAHIDVIHMTKDETTLTGDDTNSIIQKWKDLNKYEKINLHIIQGSDDTEVDESLKSLLKQIDVDVLVLFHQQRNFWKSLFQKSVTAEFVYEWSHPILTMHKK